MRFKNNLGLSLVAVLVGASLSIIAALMVTKIATDVRKTQVSTIAANDLLEFRTLVSGILNNKKHCKVTFGGSFQPGAPAYPQKFEKQNVSELDIELHVSNSPGDARLKKQFSAQDPSVKKYGSIEINSMKLLLNNEPTVNYADANSHNDIGVFRIEYEQEVSPSQTVTKTIDYLVFMELKTVGGETEILSCEHSPPPLPMAKGASENNSWYCWCSFEGGTQHRSKTTICLHSNNDYAIDQIWLGETELRWFLDTPSTNPCAITEPNPPGTDSVIWYDWKNS